VAPKNDLPQSVVLQHHTIQAQRAFIRQKVHAIALFGISGPSALLFEPLKERLRRYQFQKNGEVKNAVRVNLSSLVSRHECVCVCVCVCVVENIYKLLQLGIIDDFLKSCRLNFNSVFAIT
jgi:hypothetical protein